jgi:hypothetical protein
LCEARHGGKLVGEKNNQDFSKCLPSQVAGSASL